MRHCPAVKKSLHITMHSYIRLLSQVTHLIAVLSGEVAKGWGHEGKGLFSVYLIHPGSSLTSNHGGTEGRIPSSNLSP